MSFNGLVEALQGLPGASGVQQQQQHHQAGNSRNSAVAGAPGSSQGRPQAAQVLLEDGQILLQYLGDVGDGSGQAAGGTNDDGSVPGMILYGDAAGQQAGDVAVQPSMLAGLADSYSAHQHHAAGGGGDASAAEAQHAHHADSPAANGQYIHPSLQLPNSILVTAGTDPMQAAGLISFTFSQSPHSFFVLNTLGGAESGVTSVGVLNAALRVVLSARKINQHAVARFDLGFVPFVVSDAADGIGLLVYKCSFSPEVAKARGQVLKMEATSNPLVAGLSLFNMLQSSSQQLEVIFTADAAKVALQALAIMRINLSNNGRDVLLLASTIEYAADASGPKNYYLLKLTPTTPTLPCFQHQIDLPKPTGVAASPYASGEPSMVGRMQHSAHKPYGAADQGMQHHSGMLSPYMVAGSAGMGGAGKLGAPHHHHHHQLHPAAASPMLGMHAHGGTQHHHLLTGLAQQQQHPKGGPMGGLGAVSAAAAAAAAYGSGAAGPLLPSVPGHQQQHKQARARKADYVIVTEDTAIKNAAGAVAKVLGRVSNQGQCCPVYTEKKTDSFTTVISVAVKAIAVARGYVCNEGMGQEVGFQPYLRHLDRRLDLDLLAKWLSDRKPAGMAVGGMGAGGGALAAAAAAAGVGRSGLLGLGPMGGIAHMAMGGHAPMVGSMGGSAVPGGSGGPKTVGDGSDLLDEESMHDERCELAFDVFKVPQLAELSDAGNLPVKVTAHSRPHVVSNIISKLVTERDGAVLITAGGKAMHVAMVAVVSARARLLSRGIDIILMPKFVTVDTTSTLGWESVFLRFTIVRWAASQPLLPGAPLPPQAHLMDPSAAASALTQDTMAGRFLMATQLT